MCFSANIKLFNKVGGLRWRASDLVDDGQVDAEHRQWNCGEGNQVDDFTNVVFHQPLAVVVVASARSVLDDAQEVVVLELGAFEIGFDPFEEDLDDDATRCLCDQNLQRLTNRTELLHLKTEGETFRKTTITTIIVINTCRAQKSQSLYRATGQRWGLAICIRRVTTLCRQTRLRSTMFNVPSLCPRVGKLISIPRDDVTAWRMQWIIIIQFFTTRFCRKSTPAVRRAAPRNEKATRYKQWYATAVVLATLRSALTKPIQSRTR